MSDDGNSSVEVGSKRPLTDSDEVDAGEPQAKKAKLDEQEVVCTNGDGGASEPEADGGVGPQPLHPITAAPDAEQEAAPLPPGRYAGVVKWFDLKKGYGFIKRDGVEDVFVHQSNINHVKPGMKGLANDEPVEYEITNEGGKLRAANLTGPGGALCEGQHPDGQFPQGGMGGFGLPAPAPVGKPGTLPEHTTGQLGAGRFRGTCKWFNVTKGFGFLLPIDGTEDIFVHQSDLKTSRRSNRSLAEGENVEFSYQPDTDNKKRKACEVTGPGGAEVIGQAHTPQAPSALIPHMGMPGYGAPYGAGAYPSPYGAYPGAHPAYAPQAPAYGAQPTAAYPSYAASSYGTSPAPAAPAADPYAAYYASYQQQYGQAPTSASATAYGAAPTADASQWGQYPPQL